MIKLANKPLLKLIQIWGATILFAGLFLVNTNYVSTSNDSRFYSEQVVKYENSPWQEQIAPKWGVNYGFNPNAYMRDQFPGQLLIGILGAKIGIPAKHSLHIIELLFQIGTIFLIFLIAEIFIDTIDSLSVFYPLLLFPFAFSYNLRANHESGIAFLCALSLYCSLNISKSLNYNFLGAISGFLLLFIKGPFIIFHFLLTLIGFILSDDKNKKVKHLFINFFITSFFSFLFLFIFENLFRNVTGESFLQEFFNVQFKERALDLKSHHIFIIQKLINLWYYINHCLSYSLPWSLFAVLSLLIKRVNHSKEIHFIKSKLSYLLLSSSLVFCLVFSLSDRIAGRYIHPAYYFFTAWVFLLLYFNSPRLKQLHSKVALNIFPYLISTLWLFAFSLHFLLKN